MQKLSLEFFFCCFLLFIQWLLSLFTCFWWFFLKSNLCLALISFWLLYNSLFLSLYRRPLSSFKIQQLIWNRFRKSCRKKYRVFLDSRWTIWAIVAQNLWVDFIVFVLISKTNTLSRYSYGWGKQIDF